MNRRGKQPGFECSVHDTELTSSLLALIREGHFPRVACAHVGIGYSTFRRWCKDGKNGKSLTHAKFAADVQKARAEAEINDLRLLKLDKSWQACAWRLERRNHKRWARKDKSEVTVTSDRASSPEEVAAEIRKALAEAEKRHIPGKIEGFDEPEGPDITTSGYHG